MQLFQEKIEKYVREVEQELFELSDKVHGFAETGYEEYQSCACLSQYLAGKGYQVTCPYAGLDTAFDAVKVICGGKENGGLVIGFLGEYDALKNQGHGCAHQMQTPAMIGAALALEKLASEEQVSCEIRVIGTPAEESLDGGKTRMDKADGFRGLDLVFMVHGSDATQLENPSLALIETDVIFHGISSHAGIAPEMGRSALDAVTLTQTGLALLKGHVKDGTRINNIVTSGGFVVNSIPEYARMKLEVRYSDMKYLDTVYERALKVVEGAAIATETTFELEPVAYLPNTRINHTLGEVLIGCAGDYGCEEMGPPRECVGSTDFGVVTEQVPSCCLRVLTIDHKCPPHTTEWVKAGLEERNYQGIEDGAKCCAAAAWTVMRDEKLLEAVRREFVEGK